VIGRPYLYTRESMLMGSLSSCFGHTVFLVDTSAIQSLPQTDQRPWTVTSKVSIVDGTFSCFSRDIQLYRRPCLRAACPDYRLVCEAFLGDRSDTIGWCCAESSTSCVIAAQFTKIPPSHSLPRLSGGSLNTCTWFRLMDIRRGNVGAWMVSTGTTDSSTEPLLETEALASQG
jgi:hypothetical protein